MSEEEKILNIINCWKNGDYVLAYSFNYDRAGKQNELLLKYITNLQQENKQLKEELEKKNKKYWQQQCAYYSSILYSLEEWLEMMEEKETIGTYSMVQDKIQKLKEKYK